MHKYFSYYEYLFNQAGSLDRLYLNCPVTGLVDIDYHITA